MSQTKTLNIVPDDSLKRIHLSQGDLGRTLIFKLFDGSASYSPPAGATVKIVGTKPSGVGYSVNGTFSGNTVTIVTTSAMADEYGAVMSELVVTNQSETEIFKSANFLLMIEKDPHPAGTVDGESSVVVPTLLQLQSAIGDLTQLNTTDKSSLVGAINEVKASGNGGLTNDIKEALLDCFEHVAWIDEDGQDYYDALHDALYPPIHATAITLSSNSLSFATLNSTQTLTATVTPSDSTDTVTWASSNTSVATVNNGVVTSVAYGSATITATCGSVSATCSVTIAQATVISISAVYTQSGTVYDTDSLDSLKSDLVVTASWSNNTMSTVASADYTLSGTLAEGTSTVTVSYGGKTTTFTVTVTHAVSDTSPTIGVDNAMLAATGSATSGYDDLCVTIYYDLTQQQQTASQFVALTYCPTTPSSTQLRIVLYNGETKVQYYNGYTTSNNAVTKTLDANTTRIRTTLMKSGMSKSYLYCVDTGQILYAGSETPYYGMSNISEANA